ncbi:MAG: UvrD-helicase domain-containing protein [Flavobacteriaceae bacterium]|nr:UvrD-helicase domain-containing protein [Flavobacteriaceae bacterium]
MKLATFNIYNASAGSGKTFSLVKQYLKILLTSSRKDAFKNILAITFTNKAVGEMKDRIINSLIEFAAEDILDNPTDLFKTLCDDTNISPKQLHDKSKLILNRIMHNYGAFEVLTIDKFTQKIIRTFAYDLKLPVNFEVELDTDSLLNKAVDNLISRAGTNKELTKLLIDFAIEKADDDKSWDIALDFKNIAKLLVKENDIPYLNALKDKSISDFNVFKKELRNKTKSIEELIIEISSSALQLLSRNGLEHIHFNRKTLPNHFLKASNLSLNKLYDNKLEENIVGRKNIYTKSLDAALAETIEGIIPELETYYLSLKQAIFHYKFLKNCYKNSTPLSVLNAINHELNLIKTNENLLLISEFNTRISEAIKDQPVPFIYERIGEKFKHFFIDEFQDTSELQWHNLIPLIDNSLSSENTSAMIVGDAKQAIYRWRGGKAEQFIKLFNGHEPFQTLQKVVSLDNNYRSFSKIVNFNNQFFEFLSLSVFSNPEHSNLYKHSAQIPKAQKEGFVSVSFLALTKDDDKNEQYTEKVFQTIENCIDNGYELYDICVLVRKKKEGIAIADYLSNKGVDIVSSETLLISKSPEVIFIIDVLKFALQPQNLEHKINILKYLVRHQFDVANTHSFYVKHLSLSIIDFFKSFEAQDIIFQYKTLFEMSIYEAIEGIISSFNLVKTSDAYVQFFLDFVMEFTQKREVSLTDFIEHFEGKKETLSIIAPEGKNAVQIMTIHKSKGLEFPVVIFPYADLDIYREKDPKTWFPIDKNEFNGFSNTFINYNKDISNYSAIGKDIFAAHQSELELDNINLLYVALTRPIEQLHIISSLSLSTKDHLIFNDKQYSGLLVSYLKNAGLWENSKLEYTFGNPVKISEASKSKFITQIQDTFISIPKKDHQINIITKSGLLWDTTQQKAIEKGNLIHDIMAKIKTKDDIENALNFFLISGSINSSQKATLETMVLSIIHHPELVPYFTNAYDIYNEREIVTAQGLFLRPDRLAINSNNEVVIIDYKTGKSNPKYIQQLQNYEDALEAMQFSVIKKILVYVNDELNIKEV